MNKDHDKGDVKQAKGYVKGTTGKAFSNKSLENRDKIEPPASDAQKHDGDGKDEPKKGC